MLRHILVAGLAALFPAAAQAQCSMPAALQRRVCEMPELAALDARLVAREREVAAVTPRIATWAGRARRFRAYLATAQDASGQLLDSAGLSREIEQQIAGLDMEIARARAVMPAMDRAAILDDKCLSRWLSTQCGVSATGVLYGGTMLLWQLQEGASEEDGIGGGAMLWEAQGDAAPRPIGWVFDAATMRPPRFAPGPGLVWVPGRGIGTGEANADALFQKRGNRWVDIDMEDWQEVAAARLPHGLRIWHGVDYDFLGDGMGAETALWKPDDANCCPTGGRANLSFAIEGDRLVLTGLSVQAGASDAEWKDY
jgi:hypothetical protein